jgi:hypothetical protein
MNLYGYDFQAIPACINVKRSNYMKELIYTSPEVEIYEIQAEGVLCASNEMLDEYEGEW